MPSFRGVFSLNTDAPGAAPPDAFGPFRVLHQIGAGALGPVFRAYQPEQDRLVAVKLFRLDLEPERAHQLVAEFEKLIAADLSHPGLAAPLATGLAGVHAYLAQDFVAAESLDVAIRDSGPASLDTVIRIASQLGAALDHAAAAEILHGALHPRDILMSADDARMTGIGLTRALAQVGVSAPVRRPYTAPERVAGLPWDQRADVFSLAALLFELLTGKRVSGVGEDAASLLPDTIPTADRHALHPVFAKALAGNPAGRYGSGLALAQALTDAIGNAKPVRREGKRKRFGAEVPSLLTDLGPGLSIDRETPVPVAVPIVDAAPSGDTPLVAQASSPEPSRSESSRPEPSSPEPSSLEPSSPEILGPVDDGRHDLGELHITPPALDHDPLDLHLLAEPSVSPLDDPLHAIELEAAPLQHVGPQVLDDMPSGGHAIAGDRPVHAPTPESLAQFQRESSLPRGERPAKRQARKKEVVSDPPLVAAPVEEPVVAAEPVIDTASETAAPSTGPRPDVDHIRPYTRAAAPMTAATEEPSSSRAMWPLAATLVVGIGIGFGLAMLVMNRDHGGLAVDRTRLAPPATVISEPPVIPVGAGDAAAAPPPPSSAPTVSASAAAPPSVAPAATASTPPAAGNARAEPRPEPPAPKAASAAPGRLLVRSTPAGAAVFVDGKEVGVTPLTERDVPVGTHLVRVSHAGYVGVERHVSITEARPSQTITLELERVRADRRPAAPTAATPAPATATPAAAGRGTLVFESRPAGAQVFMDGKMVGTTPLTLESVASGDHAVHIELQGYRRWATAITLAAGERHRVAASLEQ